VTAAKSSGSVPVGQDGWYSAFNSDAAEPSFSHRVAELLRERSEELMDALLLFLCAPASLRGILFDANLPLT
jgi:hypothetical protein